MRAALGACRVRVARQLLIEGGLLAAAGGAAGLVLALLATQVLLARSPVAPPSAERGQWMEIVGDTRWQNPIGPWDATTYAGAASVLRLAAVLATFLPTLRAAAAAPLTGLRGE